MARKNPSPANEKVFLNDKKSKRKPPAKKNTATKKKAPKKRAPKKQAEPQFPNEVSDDVRAATVTQEKG